MSLPTKVPILIPVLGGIIAAGVILISLLRPHLPGLLKEPAAAQEVLSLELGPNTPPIAAKANRQNSRPSFTSVFKTASERGPDITYDLGRNVTLDELRLSEYAWYGKNARGWTHPVGKKPPNSWGLYDMHGNVWEWCADWFDVAYYERSPADDPSGPATGTLRVARGGSWACESFASASSARLQGDPGGRYNNSGFQVMLSLPQTFQSPTSALVESAADRR